MNHASYPCSIVELETDICCLEAEIGEQRVFIKTHPHSDRSSAMREIAYLEETKARLEDMRYSIA